MTTTPTPPGGTEITTAPPPPPPPPGRVPSPGAKSPRPPVHVGRIVSVQVTSASPNEIEVKLADGRTGVISKADFAVEPMPSVGSTIEVALLARDDPRQRVVLSRSWAVKQLAWERVEAARASGEPITGAVTKLTKGGLLVDLGVRAFLPASMVDENPVESLEDFVGHDITVVVTEADRTADRVVVSRRDLLRKQRRLAERDAFASLAVGKRVTGVVAEIVEYGAYVDLGGARALLHRSELSWARVNKVTDVVEVGASVEVIVIELNKSKRRIGVSIRQLAPDPLTAVEIGAVIPALVTRVVEYGVFVRIEDSDIVGLVHMTELTDLPGYRPDEVVTPGEQVYVKVLSVDFKKRRVALSVRQALWS